jgi:5-methylcytosine-specific restriction endonuclease McrA
MKSRYILKNRQKNTFNEVKSNTQHSVSLPLKHGGYKEALFKIEWKNKRQEILQRDNNKCRNCGTGEDLQVHHRQYHFNSELGRFVEPWEYSNPLLVTLCKKCHGLGHTKYEVPIIKK